jgi:CheY-like chemotaxis protein
MERVMLVEDHSAFELVVGQVDGTEVVLALTLEEGRTLLRGSDLSDVVLLDLMLPDAAISKETPLPDIISSLKRLAR